MATLLIREPTRKKHLFQTEQPQLTIGRSSDNELALAHSSVSRVHAGLYSDGGAWTIEDLQSRNGTFVNGRRIQRQALRSTDTVRIGDYELVYFGDKDSNVAGFQGVSPWRSVRRAPVMNEDTRTTLSSFEGEPLEPTLTDRLGAVIRPKVSRAHAWRPGKTKMFFGGPKGVAVTRMLDLSPAAELSWNKKGHVLKRLSWYATIEINGERVDSEPVVLEPGDDIKVGKTKFCYEVVESLTSVRTVA